MRWVMTLWLASLAYAVVRYVAFAPKNLENLPVFVLNKGVSMAAALCFAAAFLQQWRQGRGRSVGVEPGLWFRAGVYGVIAHIPMSLVVLRPAYFKEFFNGDRLNFGGEAVFLFGALTAGAVYLHHRAGWTALKRWTLSLVTLGLLFGHVLAMGICRGLNINRSHAYLPPMWLLSLIAVVAGIIFLLASRPRPGSAFDPVARQPTPPQAYRQRDL